MYETSESNTIGIRGFHTETKKNNAQENVKIMVKIKEHKDVSIGK